MSKLSTLQNRGYTVYLLIDLSKLIGWQINEDSVHHQGFIIFLQHIDKISKQCYFSKCAGYVKLLRVNL